MTEPLSAKGDGLIFFTQTGEGNFCPWVAKPVERKYEARRLPVYQREPYILTSASYVGITTDNKTFIYALYETKEGDSLGWKVDLYRFEIAEFLTRTLTLYPGENTKPLDISWDGADLLILYQKEEEKETPLYIQRFSPAFGKRGTPLKLLTEDLYLEGKNRRCSLACYPGTNRATILLHGLGLYELRLGDTNVLSI